MQKTKAAEALNRSILVLEQRQTEQGKQLKERMEVTYESLKPINILRKMIPEVAGPSELKDDLVQTAMGIISGYVSRKLLVRSSKNPILRLAGVFVQYGVTNFVANNSASIKAVGLQ